MSAPSTSVPNSTTHVATPISPIATLLSGFLTTAARDGAAGGTDDNGGNGGGSDDMGWPEAGDAT